MFSPLRGVRFRVRRFGRTVNGEIAMDHFTFWDSYREGFERLPTDADRVSYIRKIISLALDGKEPEDDHSDLKGLHILVAEDNDINWEIISAMLSMFGITTDRAENGKVCVDMISAAEEGSYTLIFMDVQMPEMNGLDATRAIRKLENPWASSIPIVAMTADAFSENITACLDAGMNGHIAKPIDVKLVIREIRRIKEGR